MDAGGDSWPVKHTIGTPNHLVLDQTAIKYDDQSVKRHFLPDSTSTFFPMTSHWKGHPGEPWVRFRELIIYWKRVESWVERSRAITYGIIWGSRWIVGEGGATAKINRHNSTGCTLQKWMRECVRTKLKLKKGGGELLNAHPELFVLSLAQPLSGRAWRGVTNYGCVGNCHSSTLMRLCLCKHHSRLLAMKRCIATSKQQCSNVFVIEMKWRVQFSGAQQY